MALAWPLHGPWATLGPPNPKPLGRLKTGKGATNQKAREMHIFQWFIGYTNSAKRNL